VEDMRGIAQSGAIVQDRDRSVSVRLDSIQWFSVLTLGRVK